MVNTVLRCASYARYSTDKQNPLSTQDQLAKSREFAQSRGWDFLEAHVYTDEEVSGATLDRNGLRALLAAAESKPRPFDALLIEDASRLSRKQADVLNLCERLNFAGVKICFITQGIDSGDDKFQLLVLARGMIDQLFMADTSKRVRRGLEGLIRRGLHTGGRCYGYRSRKDADGTRLEVFQPQAEVVRRIFELYASGASLRTIAKRLNAEGVESPMLQRGRHSRSWAISAIQTIIHNQRYLGKVIWSRQHKVRDPRTGRRVFRAKEGERPIEGADCPHLRIVSDELWSKVQARMEFVKRAYGTGMRTGLVRTSVMNAPYVFSGLLRCSSCGANMQIVAGRGRNHKSQTYGCPMNHQRGTCPNRTRVRRDALESSMFGGLLEKVLAANVVEYVLDRFEEETIKALEATGDESHRLRQRVSDLESEVGRLTDGLASGIHSPAVIGAIREREREIGAITERLAASNPVSVRARVRELRATMLAKVQNLRDCLTSDAVNVRSYLVEHVEKIEMCPQGPTYVAKGNWDLLGLIHKEGAEGQNRTAYAGLFRAALYR
jgi:site-specific DNA recombinase